MAKQVVFFCPDPECGEILGFSTRFIAKRLVEEKLPRDDVSEEEKQVFLRESEADGLFAEFQIDIDPVLGLSFPLWCSKCQDIKYVHVSLGEMYDLSLMDISKS